MRHAAWFLVSLLGAVAFGQSVPGGNTAAEGAKEHIESLKLPFSLANPQRPAAIRQQAAKPTVCAIPLLNVKLGPVKDRMPIMKPPVSAFEKSRELKLQVPAPACDQKLFQNQ
jgi:hypothetical protein